MKTRPQSPSTRRRTQAGATLIEVLVSILLMSIGLVAMAAMQVNAVQYSKTNEFRSLANLLANDLADRMRANKPGASNYNTDADEYAAPVEPADSTTSCVGKDANCSPADMASYDLTTWQQSLFHQLPQGTGYVRTAGTDQVDIWIVWTDPASAGSQAADNCPSGYLGADDVNVRCMYFRVAL